MVRTLLHVFPTFMIGGAQMRFVQLANHFGRDYRHLIISVNGGTEAFARLDPGLDAKLVEVPQVRGRTWPNLRTYRKYLRELRPDLLVTSNWGSIEWAMANFDGLVPHLHMEDGFGPDEAAGQLPRRVWTRRLVLRRSAVMLPSQTLFRIAGEIWRLPLKRLLQIPNGVDCRRFDGRADDAFAKTQGIAADLPIIGTVAALRAEKNLARLIDAFAEVVRQRPARLVIVGDGPEGPALRQRAADLGLGPLVLFTGACRQPERLLPSFTLFALSSDTEQMPISLLEAMACGLPVAATDVGDVRLMLSPDNAPCVTTGTGLAEAMLALLADPAEARRIGAANAARARAVYDQNLMFAAYRKLFDGAAGRRP